MQYDLSGAFACPGVRSLARKCNKNRALNTFYILLWVVSLLLGFVSSFWLRNVFSVIWFYLSEILGNVSIYMQYRAIFVVVAFLV